MASEDLLKKAVAAFNALSPEQQHEMMEEQRQSFAENNVALSRISTAPAERPNDFSKFVERQIEEYLLETWLYRHHDRETVTYRKVIDWVSVEVLQYKLAYLKEKVERIEFALRAKDAGHG
ncbi:hypothetical protein ABDF71_22615 [Ochrobactrum sp. WV_118_8]|uniref:hypothetical protein n=1 Tax=Brucella anthropi TaxID=529 RepID=UPI00215784AB|nr:hypothetical protein [Brucella anthropi]MCR8492800.1 hypothetical protein [Brucella anthropi]